MKKYIVIFLNIVIFIIGLFPKSVKISSVRLDELGNKEIIYSYSSYYSVETFGRGNLFPLILIFLSTVLLVLLIINFFSNIKDEHINTTIVGMFIFSLSPLILGIKTITIYNILITLTIIAIFILNNNKNPN